MLLFSSGIRQGLQSLKEGGVPPSFLIIDDGWQQTGPDTVGIKKSPGRLEAKKDVSVPSNLVLLPKKTVILRRRACLSDCWL